MTLNNDDQIEALARDKALLTEIEQMAAAPILTRPTGATLKTVYFFPNGNLAVCDRSGNQVPAEQINLFLHHLEVLRFRGLLAADTEIGYLGEILPFEQFQSRLLPACEIEEQP